MVARVTREGVIKTQRCGDYLPVKGGRRPIVSDSMKGAEKMRCERKPGHKGLHMATNENCDEVFWRYL